MYSLFFFNDTATTEIYTLSLHDALPISRRGSTAERLAESPRLKGGCSRGTSRPAARGRGPCHGRPHRRRRRGRRRSEEHTSELQSRQYLVCRLLLEKKKTKLVNKSHRK